MPTPKSKRPTDAIKAIRVPLVVLRRAEKAARKTGLTRNGFIVQAMKERADAVLGAAQSASAA